MEEVLSIKNTEIAKHLSLPPVKLHCSMLAEDAIAGPSMLLTGLNTQHTSLAIYILMRATVLASRCGIKSKRFGRICKPLTWAHGDIFLMCLSSSQILSAYILKQDSLPQSHKSFLNKHGAKDSVILNGVRDIACGLPFTDLEAIERFYESNGVDIKLDPQMKIPCSIIHGNQACGSHFFSFLLQAYKRALPVYLPVYLIPALIVHRQGLLKSLSIGGILKRRLMKFVLSGRIACLSIYKIQGSEVGQEVVQGCGLHSFL